MTIAAVVIALTVRQGVVADDAAREGARQARAGLASKSAAREGARQARADALCTNLGRTGERLFALCRKHARGDHGTFHVRENGSWRYVRADIRRRGSPLIGHWVAAMPSPDGRTLLAQWSAECEAQVAFFVPVDGGAPRAVSGHRDWADSPSSAGFGWTPSGEARIAFHRGGGCGSAIRRPGVYLARPGERVRFVRPFAKRDLQALSRLSVASQRRDSLLPRSNGPAPFR